MVEAEVAGLKILIGNMPIEWSFEFDGKPLDDIVEVAIFGTVDSPVEVHLLRNDREAFESLFLIDRRMPAPRSAFEYQESYYGRLMIGMARVGGDSD